LIIIAIRKVTGKMIFNPGPREVLEEGDVLVAIGKYENFERFARQCSQVET
jgi:voltage-gated potassium channel